MSVRGLRGFAWSGVDQYRIAAVAGARASGPAVRHPEHELLALRNDVAVDGPEPAWGTSVDVLPDRRGSGSGVDPARPHLATTEWAASWRLHRRQTSEPSSPTLAAGWSGTPHPDTDEHHRAKDIDTED